VVRLSLYLYLFFWELWKIDVAAECLEACDVVIIEDRLDKFCRWTKELKKERNR